ncbi:protein of unknown function [Pseudomonas sp. JV551A1]|uniref:Uncharacterized protein n=1 Tax=Pseudomonas inefficax TaxID=2078786 RepID=A0AAQ1P9A0_9PSED|nr:protein of unknown function [Pseudomonas sp. JV551A1]SPO60960.1 protein of unknown function [Pseudomonas inefficax]
MGAALAANTGVAGAMHRVGFFAAKAAPTSTASPSSHVQYLWERACPRTSAEPVPCTVLDSSRLSRSHIDRIAFKPCAVPVGAGMPANTGGAGAIHRVVAFAGTPAPTVQPEAPGNLLLYRLATACCTHCS